MKPYRSKLIMTKLVIFLSALAISSMAFAAKSDDVLQNIPSDANKQVIAENTATTSAMPQSGITTTTSTTKTMTTTTPHKKHIVHHHHKRVVHHHHHHHK